MKLNWIKWSALDWLAAIAVFISVFWIDFVCLAVRWQWWWWAAPVALLNGVLLGAASGIKSAQSEKDGEL